MEAVGKLERKNRELEREEQMLNAQNLSSLGSFSSSALTDHLESEELEQKVTFQEEQIAKLNEQLKLAREGLTLEREKSRQLELDLWKKEKEPSDIKIDARIATLTDKLICSSKKENRSTIPLNYRDLETKLEKKNVECRSLADQVNKYKAELAASKSESSSAIEVLSNRELNKGDAMTEQARCQLAIPLPHRDLSRITQSPGTQVRENLFSFFFFSLFITESKVNDFILLFFRVRRHSTVVTPVKECTTTFVIG